MKTKTLRLVLLATFFMNGGCVLKRDAGAVAGGAAADEAGGTSAKALASLWEVGAFSADMLNAVSDGSSFTASFWDPSGHCTCTMVLTGNDSAGTYTSSCSRDYGTIDCGYYNAPLTTGTGSNQCLVGTPLTASYSLDGTTLRLGNCNQQGALGYQ
ncbi:MAG: hypothetical protein ABIR96_02945 [Bdellovibrionota bacterium]